MAWFYSAAAAWNLSAFYMDQITQQNAAMVEETTAASQSLASEAEQMAELIGQFRFTGKVHAVAPTRSSGRGPSRPKPTARSEIRRPSTPARTSGNLALKAQPVEEGWEEF